jgi:hypothetical protein
MTIIALDGSSTAGTGRSDASHQQENDHDEQDCADDAHPAIAEAIAIAAEAAAEAAEQKYDQNYDKYGSKRHDEFSLSMIALIGSYHGLQWFLRAVPGWKSGSGEDWIYELDRSKPPRSRHVEYASKHVRTGRMDIRSQGAEMNLDEKR